MLGEGVMPISDKWTADIAALKMSMGWLVDPKSLAWRDAHSTNVPLDIHVTHDVERRKHT